MATTVSYNGVVLQNVLTRVFDQEPVYDESNTDKLYDRFKVIVVGYCHGFTSSNTTYITPRGYPTATEQESHVRKLLMEPRKEFKFRVGSVNGEGGAVLLESLHAEDGRSTLHDVNNGPKPLGCHVKHVVGAATLRIEFSIEVCVIDCEYSLNSSGVINNRWQMSDSYDDKWKCTRTIRGRLRIAHINLNPQAFRGWVVPPLQASFRRQSMNFVTSRNGLELDYEIVDREEYAAAPFPAIKFEATHTESSGDGVNSFGDLHVRMTGPPRADKKLLIQTAAILAESRLQLKSMSAGKSDFLLEQMAIVDHLHENTIEMRVRVRHVNADLQHYFGTIGELLGRKLSDRDIPDYDALRSQSPGQSDLTTVAGLFICYLQSPCNDDHKVFQFKSETESELEGEKGDDGPETHSETGVLPPSFQPDWSLSHKEHIYTHYTLDARYEVDTLRVQLPIASNVQGDNPQNNGQGGSDATSAVVRLGRGTAKRIITIEAERADTWPEIPIMDDYTDVVGVALLIDRFEIAPSVRLAKDGSRRVFAMGAVYRFALPRIPLAGEYRAPQLPLMGTSNPSQAEDLIVSSDAFKSEML